MCFQHKESEEGKKKKKRKSDGRITCCDYDEASKRTGRERNKVLITRCLLMQRYQKRFAKCIRGVSYFVIYCVFIASPRLHYIMRTTFAVRCGEAISIQSSSSSLPLLRFRLLCNFNERLKCLICVLF